MPSATGLSTETWYIVTFVIITASGIISYFLKKTMDKVDTHDKDINVIKQTYVTDERMKEMKFELENDIKSVKEELDSDIKQLTFDVSEIKENFLKSQDFYRVQANTDKKLDKMYDLLLKMSGGVKSEQ